MTTRKKILLGIATFILLIVVSVFFNQNLQFFRGSLLPGLTLNSPSGNITSLETEFNWSQEVPAGHYLKLTANNISQNFDLEAGERRLTLPFDFLPNTNYSWTICTTIENGTESCITPAKTFTVSTAPPPAGNGNGPQRGSAQEGTDATGLNFSSPQLAATAFTNTTEGEYQVLTHTGTNPTVDRTNQTEAEFRFFTLRPGKFKASILSQIPQTSDFTPEATLQTPKDNFQSITSTGATNPVSLKWDKTCETTVDCSTANQRTYYLHIEAELTSGTGSNTQTDKFKYFIEIDLKNPVLNKVITSCTQTVNIGGDIVCTGRIPNNPTVEGLKIKLVDQNNETVNNTETDCQPTSGREISCTMQAPETTGSYKVIASSTNPDISAEQVGTVTVIDYDELLEVIVSPSKIRTGDATRIVFNLDEDTEYISLTARVVGPKGFSRTIFFRCHESLTAFECPNTVSEKIQEDRIAIDWVADEVPAGVYNIVAFARISNEGDSITATAQIEVEPGTCDSMFSDVQPSDPACLAIADLRTRGIWYGARTEDGRRAAQLDRPLLRAEFLALGARLYEKVNVPAFTGVSSLLMFNDITEQIARDPNNQFWVTPAGVLLSNNIISGFREDNTLRPGAQLRMSELAKITALSTNFIGYYDDNRSPWYSEIMEIYNMNGISFNPEAIATRRDAVMLIYDTLQLSERIYIEDTIQQNQQFGIDPFASEPMGSSTIIQDGFHNFSTQETPATAPDL